MHLCSQYWPMQVRHVPPTRGDLEMRLRCAGAQAMGPVWATSTAAFSPECHTCEAGEVFDIVPLSKATQVLKPEGLHKVVQRQGNLEPLPAPACKRLEPRHERLKALTRHKPGTPAAPSQALYAAANLRCAPLSTIRAATHRVSAFCEALSDSWGLHHTQLSHRRMSAAGAEQCWNQQRAGAYLRMQSKILW